MKAKRAERDLKAAIDHHQAGRLAEAEELYRSALRLNPDIFLALHNLGVIALEAGRFDQAVTLFQKSIRLKPDYTPAHGNLGIALEKAGRFPEAIASFTRAIRLNPRDGSNYFNLANSLRREGRLEEAVVAYRQALTLNPDDAEAQANLGATLTDLKRPEDAIEACRRAVAIAPRLADARINLGNALRLAERYEEAMACYQEATALAPRNAVALVDLARVLVDQKRPEEALTRCVQALAIDPVFSPAHETQGCALVDLERFDEAMASFDRAIALTPSDYRPHLGRATVFLAQKKLDLAIRAYLDANALKPDNEKILVDVGFLLFNLGNYGASLAAFSKALEIKEECAEAIFGMGNAFLFLGSNAKAAICYRRALALHDDSHTVHNGLGYALGLDGLYDEAIAEFEKAEELSPGGYIARLVYFQQKACDWRTWPQRIPQLVESARDKDGDISFLCMSSVIESAETMRVVAERFTERFPPQTPLAPADRPAHDKLRLGYLSADFHDHAVMHLIAEVFERHDRTKFEVTGYSYGPPVDHQMRRRVAEAVDRFVDIRDLSFADAATRIFEDGTDILVDLTGYTMLSRSQIVTYRPAPITVSFLGFPGSMGAPFFDYIIADPYLAPFSQQPFYAERIVQLPHCYQPSDSKRQLQATTRAACHLPEDAIVLCAFNTPSKITREVYDVWMRLLKSEPRAVLWLSAQNAITAANLVREAEARGVEADRLVFADRAPFELYLGRLALADLFLDCYPYNAGATANDALWVGLPLLTCSGETYVSRMAGALLTALDLPELIAASLEDYEARARELVADPARLAAVRDKLARARETSPLFDTTRFTRNLESAYQEMWRGFQAGVAPASFRVAE